MIIRPNLAKALIRNDLRFAMQAGFRTLNPGEHFVWSPYLALVADTMERVRRGELKRVIFNVSPRLGKSTAITVIANAWLMGHQPWLEFIVVSYGEDLANKLSRDHKVLVTSPMWMKAFPEHRIDPNKDSDAYFHTTARGSRKGASMFGSLTGYGADIIFIDDPHKGTEVDSPNSREKVIAAFENGVASRLNDKENGVIIVVMQRFHEEDLTGYLIEKGGFTVISLPAIAIQDEYFPMLDGRAFVRSKGELLCAQLLNQAGLDNARRDHGLAIFEAQYQQNPTASGANLVDWSWFDPYDEPLDRYLYTFQSWDVAITDKESSNYSACVTMGYTGDKLHLLDVYRAKLRHDDASGKDARPPKTMECRSRNRGMRRRRRSTLSGLAASSDFSSDALGAQGQQGSATVGIHGLLGETRCPDPQSGHLVARLPQGADGLSDLQVQ